jgi:hypothetical protein
MRPAITLETWAFEQCSNSATAFNVSSPKSSKAVRSGGITKDVLFEGAVFNGTGAPSGDGRFFHSFAGRTPGVSAAFRDPAPAASASIAAVFSESPTIALRCPTSLNQKGAQVGTLSLRVDRRDRDHFVARRVAFPEAAAACRTG